MRRSPSRSYANIPLYRGWLHEEIAEHERELDRMVTNRAPASDLCPISLQSSGIRAPATKIGEPLPTAPNDIDFSLRLI